MKANVGDFINPPDHDESGRSIYNPQRVIAIEGDDGYLLENGQVIADSEITGDDVLLESEIF